MARAPWRGRFIDVDAHGEVSWIRCANCGRELRDVESRRRGIGPDCLRDNDAAELDRLREAALEEDRERWRLGVSGSTDPEAVRRRRERARREPRTEEQEARWAVLQDALARRERAVIDRHGA